MEKQIHLCIIGCRLILSFTSILWKTKRSNTIYKCTANGIDEHLLQRDWRGVGMEELKNGSVLLASSASRSPSTKGECLNSTVLCAPTTYNGDMKTAGSQNFLSRSTMKKELKSLNTTLNVDKNKNLARKYTTKQLSRIISDLDTDYSQFGNTELIYGHYLQPVPEKWKRTSQTIMFLWFKQRKRLVHFTEEVIKKAETDQFNGETMGKLREVRRSSKDRRKLSTILYPNLKKVDTRRRSTNTSHILPEDLPYPPNWRSWLLGENPDCLCNCFAYLLCLHHCKKGKKRAFSPEEEEITPPYKYSAKFRVTEQKLAKSLDVIEDFVFGNMKTVDFTLGVIGLLHRDITSGIEISESAETEQHFNHIAAGVWFFTFAIEELFQKGYEPPTKSEFDDLITEFTNLAVLVDRIARRTVIYSQLYTTFGEMSMTLLRNAANRLHIESEYLNHLQICPPMKLGTALHILPSSQKLSTEHNFFKIVTRPHHIKPRPKGENPWLSFGSQSKSFKLEYLKDFVSKLQHRMISLNIQMRFLSDDIFEENIGRSRWTRILRGKMPKQPTFLSAIYSLDVAMYRFSVFKETTPKYEKALMATMEAVSNDIHDLLVKGEKIIHSIVEVRDMVELAYNYMADVYTVDFGKLMPAELQFNNSKKTSCRRFCTKLGIACGEETVEPSLGFCSDEFFNTDFPPALQKHSMIDRKTGFEFALQAVESSEKKRIPISFLEDDISVYAWANSSKNLFGQLEPVPGSGGVWDDLSATNITRLKDQVTKSSPDAQDIHPAVAREITKREEFKKELNAMYAQGKVIIPHAH